jgi:hypothetical protein
MAATAKLIYLYDLASTISTTLTVDQIVSTIIFGTGSIPGIYDGSHKYKKGDLCTYIDSAGTIHVLECIEDTTDNPIDLEAWQEYSILSAINNTTRNLILLSEIRPEEEANKVWLQYRGGGSGIPEDNYGLIVKNNFIISVEEPDDFTTDLIWGKVQVG